MTVSPEQHGADFLIQQIDEQIQTAILDGYVSYHGLRQQLLLDAAYDLTFECETQWLSQPHEKTILSGTRIVLEREEQPSLLSSARQDGSGSIYTNHRAACHAHPNPRVMESTTFLNDDGLFVAEFGTAMTSPINRREMVTYMGALRLPVARPAAQVAVLHWLQDGVPVRPQPPRDLFRPRG